jgi:hypothetical protein
MYPSSYRPSPPRALRGTLAVMQNTTFLHSPAIRNAFIGDQSHGDRRHTQPSCFHAACTFTVASHWRVSRIFTLPQSSMVKPRRCRVLARRTSGERGRSALGRTFCLTRPTPSATGWGRLLQLLPHKTSLLKHRAFVRISTEKETPLARDLRIASTSHGYQTFAPSLHALWRNSTRHRR